MTNETEGGDWNWVTIFCRSLLILLTAHCAIACTEEGTIASGSPNQTRGDDSAAPARYVEPAPPFVDPSKTYEKPPSTSVELFKTAQGYVIEVRNPEGFPVRAEDPYLYVGSATFTSSGLSHRVGPYGMIYKLTPEQWDALEEGAEIATGWRGSPSESYGTLNRAELAVESH